MKVYCRRDAMIVGGSKPTASVPKNVISSGAYTLSALFKHTENLLFLSIYILLPRLIMDVHCRRYNHSLDDNKR
jgi:hypothetical protein